jgi:hypothetical protein
MNRINNLRRLEASRRHSANGWNESSKSDWSITRQSYGKLARVEEAIRPRELTMSLREC